jgi:hypothetical protein
VVVICIKTPHETKRQNESPLPSLWPAVNESPSGDGNDKGLYSIDVKSHNPVKPPFFRIAFYIPGLGPGQSPELMESLPLP